MSRTMAVIQPRLAERGARMQCTRKLGGQSLLERVVAADYRLRAPGARGSGDRQPARRRPRFQPRPARRCPCSSARGSTHWVGCATPSNISARRAWYAFRLIILASIRCLSTGWSRRAADNPACDYISYCMRDGQPAILSPLGVFAEWCSATALLQADRRATAPADRAQVTRFIYSHPELFRVRLIATPAELDRDDLRLTVTHEDDWEHLHTIYDALGPEGLDWRRASPIFCIATRRCASGWRI